MARRPASWPCSLAALVPVAPAAPRIPPAPRRLALAAVALLAAFGAGAEGFVPEVSLVVVEPTLESCPPGMAREDASWGSFCIDLYEAARSGNDLPVSVPGMRPWTGLAWEESRDACDRAGKRLCRDREWLAACDLQGRKYGLVDEEEGERHGCHTLCRGCAPDASGAAPTGSRPECRSAAGVFDLVGNVAEWTDGAVPEGGWPGAPRAVGELIGGGSERYGDDRVRPPPDGGGAGNHLRRGGSWSAEEADAPGRAGCFALDYSSPGPDAVTGFRCCWGPGAGPEGPGTLEGSLADHERDFLDAMEGGVAHARIGAFGSALASFEAARALSPASPEARNAVAVALAGLGRVDDALSEADGVLSQDSSNRQALFNKGVFLIRLGRYQEAAEAYGRLLASAPGDVKASRNLAYARSVLEGVGAPAGGEPSPGVPPGAGPSEGASPSASEHPSQATPAGPATPSPVPTDATPTARPSATGPAPSLAAGVLLCPAHLVRCGDTCVETGSDQAHCGSCLWRCLPDQRCVGGYCVELAPSTWPEGGGASARCDDGLPCTEDEGEPPGCAHRPAACGTPCGAEGACDGRGSCGQRRAEGEGCACDQLCERGLVCRDQACTPPAVCGDGVCERECAACPQDCLPGECAGDRLCSPPLGEGCGSAPGDCPCAPGLACHPGAPEALADGCAPVSCGDGRCDPPEGPAGCCPDCPCGPGARCDGASGMCVLACGDGLCGPGDCALCPGECTCRECRCAVELAMPASMELASGERRSLEVAVRNAGELEGNFRLLADAPVGVGAPYDRSLRLAPGATAREAVPLAPQRAGSYELVVRAQGASGEPRAERRVRLIVREGGSGPWSLPSARGLLPWLLPPLALALLLNLRRRAGPSWGFR